MDPAEHQWTDAVSPDALEKAFRVHDDATIGGLLDALCADLDRTGRRIDANTAKKVLGTLRRHTSFDQLARLAAKFAEHAQVDEQVLRQLAQAHIELGEITVAVEGLLALRERIEARLASHPDDAGLRTELGETLGLLGRAYKQYYVNAAPSRAEPRSHDFDRALGCYEEAYEKKLGDHLWAGINTVALRTHRTRVARGRPNAVDPDAEARARNILAAIEEAEARGPLRPWDLANRIEAHLAAGDTTAAIEATKAYLAVADAFAVRGTRRQLAELWLLREDAPPGDKIMPMMDARLAELGGAPQATLLDPGKAPAYEKVFGQTGYQPLQWLVEALVRARSIARLGPSKYEGHGTGFLFDGAWISDTWAGAPLLLTNAHVCSPDPAVRAQRPYPAPPEALTAAFLGLGSAQEAEELKIEGVVWTSPPNALDATLLVLERVPTDCEPPPLVTLVPPVTRERDPRLNVLGHPRGLELGVSLQDNETVSVGDTLVHYRTPTDPGSSGSPVFNHAWQLVALHHASSAHKKANEGVRIDVIIAAIREALVSA